MKLLQPFFFFFWLCKPFLWFSCVSRNNSYRSGKATNLNVMHSSGRERSEHIRPCCRIVLLLSDILREIFSSHNIEYQFSTLLPPPPNVYYEVTLKDKNQSLMCLYEAKANAVARVHLLHACAQSLFHIFSASSSLWPLGGRPAAWWLEGHWLKLAPAVTYIPCTVPATNGNSLMTSLAGSPPCPLPLPLGLC